MLDHLLPALALLLILEGAMPFVLPKIWRETFTRLISFNDGQLRFMGLLSIVIGLIVMYCVG